MLKLFLSFFINFFFTSQAFYLASDLDFKDSAEYSKKYKIIKLEFDKEERHKNALKKIISIKNLKIFSTGEKNSIIIELPCEWYKSDIMFLMGLNFIKYKKIEFLDENLKVQESETVTEQQILEVDKLEADPPFSTPIKIIDKCGNGNNFDDDCGDNGSGLKSRIL